MTSWLENRSESSTSPDRIIKKNVMVRDASKIDDTDHEQVAAIEEMEKDDGPHVKFSDLARVLRIQIDQLPPRPTRMDRSVSNPNRRKWVLFRLFKVGGRYNPNPRKRQQFVQVDANTPWPGEWGQPPPPPTLKESTKKSTKKEKGK